MMNKTKSEKKIHILHVAVLAAVATSFGTSFDAWWHVSQGRDSFFVLPHLFIYSGILIILFQSFLAWRYLKLTQWRRIFFAALLIPLSAPFDELWHQFRGKESIDSILIVWSPPHAVLFISAMVSMVFILKEIVKERDILGRNVFGTLLLAGLFNIASIFLGPFLPLGPFALLGFWGAIVLAFIYILSLLIAERLFPVAIPALLVGFFVFVLQSVVSDSGIVSGSLAAGTFLYTPNWLLGLFYISTAAIISIRTQRTLLRNALSIFIGSVVLYIFPLWYVSNPGYNLLQGLIGVGSSIAGALLATVVISFFLPNNKLSKIK